MRLGRRRCGLRPARDERRAPRGAETEKPAARTGCHDEVGRYSTSGIGAILGTAELAENAEQSLRTPRWRPRDRQTRRSRLPPPPRRPAIGGLKFPWKGLR